MTDREPPPERRLESTHRQITFGGACVAARWLLSQYLVRPHIWKRGGRWHVGWRYVGPAEMPQEAGE